MTASSFSISSSSPPLTLVAGGGGVVSFDVKNVSSTVVRCQVRLAVQGETQAAWLKITDPVERDLAPAEVWHPQVEIQVPAGAAPGKHSFRLDACATDNPEENYVAGPPVSFEVTPPVAKPAPKALPPWVFWAGLSLVVLAGAVAVWFILPKSDATVVVPDFTRAHPHIDVVMRLYGGVDLTIQREEKFDGEGFVSEGCVFDQSPKPGEKAKAGSTVTLYTQPPLTTVPSLIGLDPNAAARLLLQSKLDMTESYRPPLRGESLDTVIKQDPLENTKVPQRHKVRITIARIRGWEWTTDVVRDLEVLRSSQSPTFRPERLRDSVNR